VKEQRQLIDDAEKGVYTEGMYSHFVPASHKPYMPIKDHFPRLFDALSKKRIKASENLQKPKLNSL